MNAPATTRRISADEAAAIKRAREAHDAVSEAKLLCLKADMTGSEIATALREASMALLYAIRVMEGRT